jgi:hypothetical protein
VKTLFFASGVILAIAGVGTAGTQNEGGHAESATNNEAPEQPSLYVVDGLALGDRVHFGSTAYRAYKCSPSDQFDGFTWCQRSEQEGQSKRRAYSTNSILHRPDGRTAYINHYLSSRFNSEWR